jgi:histidine triad (HIT) family protein
MASIFSKIVTGEIPSYKVAENDHYLAFLDIFPLKKGHVLVIPKREVDYLFDLDHETFSGLWEFAHKVAKGLEKAIACERIGIAVLGMEVPHAHIHLVPLDHEGDLNFGNPKLKFTNEGFEEIAKTISAQIH